MKSSTITTKMKDTQMRAEPKTIHTVDVDVSAALP